MNELGWVLIGILIMSNVGILFMLFKQQSFSNQLNQQLWSIQENMLKETQAIKTTQLMQSSHLQEDVSSSFNVHLAPLYQSLNHVSSLLGELPPMAHNVNALKQVLSKEKSKGLLGEVSLEALLSSLLPSSSYIMQASHPSFGNNKVDALITISGEKHSVLVPVDAKVPLSDYEVYVKEPTSEHWNGFVKAVKTQAKSIQGKYIRPPYTSDFALMYIPFESLVSDLYQETHLLHHIFQESKVYIVSPMTLHAFINVLMLSMKQSIQSQHAQQLALHMDELMNHLHDAQSSIITLHKKHNEIINTLNTLSHQLNRIDYHLEGLEVSKNLTNNELG